MEMEKRTLGKTGLEVGVIGFGTEHIEAYPENIDRILDMGVELGMNYIDLLFNDLCVEHIDNMAVYWDALQPGINRLREQLVLCLHWGYFYEQPIELCQRYFEQTLTRIKDGHVEIAMISMVDRKEMWESWATRALERLDTYRSKGDIRFIGLANHNPEVAQIAVESGLIDVLMFPVNLYQHPKDPEREKLLKTCRQHGVGIVAMKPYYGGILLQRDGHPTGITPAQCLQYVLSQPVDVVVPGVKNAEQMQETLQYITSVAGGESHIPLLEDLDGWLKGQCVRCNHCLPCPEGVPIPTIIHYLNYVSYFGPAHLDDYNRSEYLDFPVKASDCIACEICLERCPFDVDIIGKMQQAVEVFGV